MILALGNPVYDYIETKKIKTDGRILSGCSTNAALALSKMGRELTLVGSVGEDFSKSFLADMKGYGIEAKALPSRESGGFSLIYYDDFGNRHLDLLGRAEPITAIDDDLLAKAEAVLIGPILREISFDLIRDIRRKFDGLFFCDPQGLLRGAGEDGRIYHEKPEGIEEIGQIGCTIPDTAIPARIKNSPYRSETWSRIPPKMVPIFPARAVAPSSMSVRDVSRIKTMPQSSLPCQNSMPEIMAQTNETPVRKLGVKPSLRQ